MTSEAGVPFPFSFGVGQDGSKLATSALTFISALIKRRGLEQDKVKALHISAGAEKEHLVPDHLKEEHLKAQTEEISGAGGTKRMEWFSQARDKECSTGENLCKLVMESKVDFMSVGTFGRKDHDDDKHLGSTGAEPLKLMSCGCFVVKNTSVIPTDEPMTWLVASDDSDYSMKAIQDAKKLMKQGDRLIIFYPTTGTVGMRTSDASVDAFKARKEHKYNQMCDEFVFELKEPGDSVADIILKFAADRGADILVTGHKGLTYSYMDHSESEASDELAKTHLGSTSTLLVGGAKCTVLITKGRVDGFAEGMWAL